MGGQSRTALGSAHERFARGLPERGRELRDLCSALQATPTDGRLVEQLRKRLHALYASAQVFQETALLETIHRAIAGLDAARDDRRPLVQSEIALALELCAQLGVAHQGDFATAKTVSTAPFEAERVSSLTPKERWSGPPLTTRVSEIEGLGFGDPAVPVNRSVAGTLRVPDVIAVLVVAGRDIEREVRAALPVEQCEFTSSSDAETALLVLDQVSPDIVLVETSFLLNDGAALVQRLRGARAASVRAVVALVPALQVEVEGLLAASRVDAALRMPLPRTGLAERLLRICGRGVRTATGLGSLDAGTVDEIARGVAEEVRRGIADSLRQGRGERIELNDKSELMAAAWSAVTRIRTQLAAQADGRLRFDEAPYAGGPAALALTDRSRPPDLDVVADGLKGRRILIADDDPAVVWFFAGLVREAGGIAIEAADGKQALEFARRKPPDLVVSDILMPGIDGFTLCRELQRDAALCHVPVILLSWKEDFLQRMRELDAGASGYLRKEAGSTQILTTLSEALRPRAELAALLAAGGEVQGRIDTLGVPTLLETVAAALPDARITLRDAWNMFEVDLRSGNTLSVTRTASDGSFARGAVALRQLLGVDVGRFTVVAATGPVRGAFEEPLDKLLSDGVAQLCALVDAVSDTRLLEVERVVFDDEVFGSLLTATPTSLADVAARLRAGTPVKELLSGGHAPGELERDLRELARRGAVLEVRGADDKDLVGAARRAREERPGELLHGGQRPSPVPAIAGEIVDAESEWVRPRRSVVMPQLATNEAPGAAPDAAPRESRATQPESELAAPQVTSSDKSAAPLSSPPPASKPPEAFRIESALLQGQSPISRTRSTSTGSVRPPAQFPVPAPARGGGTLGLALTLSALMAAGFFGWRILRPRRATTSISALSSATTVHAAQPSRSGTPEPGSDVPLVALERGRPDAGLLPQGGTRALPYIDRSYGVAVSPDQGLLVVELAAAGTPPPHVRVGGRDLGQAPVAVALSGGRHELMLKRGDHTSFRYVVLRPGETRVFQVQE